MNLNLESNEDIPVVDALLITNQERYVNHHKAKVDTGHHFSWEADNQVPKATLKGTVKYTTEKTENNVSEVKPIFRVYQQTGSKQQPTAD